MKDVPDTPKVTKRSFDGRLQHLRDVLAPARPLRVADIGANPINVPEYTALLNAGGCEVWGFEPDETAFDALQAEAAPGTHFVQRGVGKAGQATFYPHKLSGLGSLFEVDKPSVEFLGRPGWHSNQQAGISIDLVALDAISDADLPNPDLLKMDVQGAELSILQNGRKKLTDAVCVIPEVRFFRIYENEPMWSDVDMELRAQGFVLHKMLPANALPIGSSLRGKMTSKHFRNQMVDGDLVYIRDPATISDWTDEQIKQLAIAGAGVFNSLDLVIYCMDQLVDRGVIGPEAPETFFKTLPKWIRKQG